MFEKKVSSLMSNNNSFVEEAIKATHTTLSSEGSLKYTTSGNDFVDQFSCASKYREPRSYGEIDRDMKLLWSQDPLKALKFTVYLRMITRKTQYVNLEGKDLYNEETESTQRGTGLRNEAILRMMWIAINHPLVFANNIFLFISAGSWRDIFTMLSLDLQYNGWKGRKLNWNIFIQIIALGLMNEKTTHLVRKYLPTIRPNKKCTTLEAQADTLIGRWLANSFFPKLSVVDRSVAYRKLKREGLAHQWQQKISQQKYDSINFDTIAGRALTQIANSKFLGNHNLEKKFLDWLDSKPTAKFTGYVHELFAPYEKGIINVIQRNTINKQFAHLVEIGKTQVPTKLWAVRDISGSMTAQAIGCNVSANAIAKALALYFSEMLEGDFKDSFAVFSRECTVSKWIGNTPTEKWENDTLEAYGSTNPLSVANLLVTLRKKIPESDFPEGVLMLSDGEFQRSDYSNETAFQNFRNILIEGGFSKEFAQNFKLILWDIPNNFYYENPKPAFEDFANVPNSFHISGYDGAIVSFILGGESKKSAPKTSEELFEAAMDQELLNKLKV